MSRRERVEELKDVMLFKINCYTILTMLAAVFVDILLGYLAGQLQLPFWLDLIGTMIVAIQFGPIAGALNGTVSVTIMHLVNNGPVAYALVGAAVGFIVGFFYPRKRRNDTLSMISCAIFAGILAALISVPFNFIYYDGATGNVWGDALNDMLQRQISNSRFNNLIAEMFVDIPDKVVSIFAASLLVKLEEAIFLNRGGKGTTHRSNHRNQKSHKNRKSGKRAAVSSLLILTLGLGLLPASGAEVAEAAETADYQSDYEYTIFGFKDGIPSSEINTVVQTEDGYIWIGTYSGLYVYDGIRFEKATMKQPISSVITLFVDSKGRLWIGTNDSGAIVYDIHSFEYKVYNKENGLTSNSIRSIGEDSHGNVYLGTSLALAKVDTKGKATSYEDEKDLYYADSFYTLPDGSIVGIGTSGNLFRLRDDKVIFSTKFSREDGIFYRSVSGNGAELLVGTSGNIIDRYLVRENDLFYQNYISVPPLNYINHLEYNESSGGYFICCENGMSFLEPASGRVTKLFNTNFNYAVEDVCVDYQGNVWFASSKQGLIKYSYTYFRNPYTKVGMDPTVTNALLLDGNRIYIGTDEGLRVIDLANMKRVGTSYLANLEKLRIRHIMKDSKGNLWFSTYSEEGLVKVDPQFKIKTFSDEAGGYPGMQCRTALELSDGTILAASKKGLTFIQDDKVIDSIGVDEGLNTSLILTLYEREDGSILAGSDGDGIYIIKDRKIIGHVGEKEGLKTAVVLRIVKCTGGYLYVTSDSIYYDNGRSIKQLRNFPYTNNYDVMITKDGNCWITSSAGLYRVKESALLGNGADYTYTLMNEDWGLKTSFTANSWNVLTDDYLYLCCTDGIRILDEEVLEHSNNTFEAQLKFIETVDERIFHENGKYVIPASTGRINFNIAVNNSSLSNPTVHYYLEGSSDEGITCAQSEILPLSFTDLPYGDYTLHIDVMDTDGRVFLKKAIPVTKEAMMYEKMYFRIYLGFVLLALVAYVCWLFMAIHRKTMNIIGLQKEISTDPMTGLLNKAGSYKTLTQVCKEETGILMMIDLDSFKLVNDLYGHDMGDKILIRFAELIKGAMDENDVTGRIGGDEFIGFMKRRMDEDDVQKLTRYLNRELMKSAKEYMGEDMNIPLGTSIGAVRVPVEGRDFDELHKLADKALYVVKQNGKHGYSFYQKKRSASDDEVQDNNSIDQMKQIMGERNEGKGAFFVNFEKLQVIYKFLNRNDNVTDATTGFLRFTLVGEDISDETKDAFEDFLIVNLRKNDVVSRYAGRFFVLCVGRNEEEFEEIAKRIAEKWEEAEENDDTTVLHEVERVG